MRVKICGIRSPRDLCAAVAAGADAVGLLCGLTHVSEDRLEPEAARALIANCPSGITTVLVTHLIEPKAIGELARYCGAGAVQLHGEYASVRDEAAAVAAVRAKLDAVTAGSEPRRVPLVRAVHVGCGPPGEPGEGEGCPDSPGALDSAWRHVEAVAGSVDAILLDSRTPDRLGGTGEVHDWSVSARIRHRAADLGLPTVLAGGLTPRNLPSAIAAVRPAGVDVNSGVEDLVGDKDPKLVREFVRSARRP